jgi:hypothetical protein
VTLPGADEHFRATAATAAGNADPASDRAGEPRADRGRLAAVRLTTPVADPDAAPGRPSGRQKHDEKITVYVSPEELVKLEQARLELRAAHGLAVDRGRIVREAVAVVLADLAAKGGDSILVRRLRDH